mgnify:FL=1
MIECVNAARKHFGQPIVIESGKKMELWTAERKRQLEEQVQALLSLEVNWHTQSVAALLCRLTMVIYSG